MSETKKQTGLVIDDNKLRQQLAIGKSNDILIALADDQRWRAMNRSADVMASSIVGKHLMGHDYNETKAILNCLGDVGIFSSRLSAQMQFDMRPEDIRPVDADRLSFF